MSARPKVTVAPEALQQFVNYYFETCEKYRVTPQPQVINAVRGAAQDPRKLKTVVLRRLGLGNGDVFALAEVLSKFYIIRELDLRDNAITDEGAEALLMTARAQLKTALKDRLPPSQFKASYLLSAVQLSGNRIGNPGVVANLNAHLQLLLKEQLKIVAHHVRDHVRQQSLENPANTDPSTIQLADLRAGLRSLSLPGSVTPRVAGAVKQRGGSIDNASFVDLVHSELLSQSKLNSVDPRQAQILQEIAAQRDDPAPDEGGSVLTGMSSLSDSSHNTASVLTGSPGKNPRSGKRKQKKSKKKQSASASTSMAGSTMDDDDDDDESASMSLSMSMGTTATGASTALGGSTMGGSTMGGSTMGGSTMGASTTTGGGSTTMGGSQSLSLSMGMGSDDDESDDDGSDDDSGDDDGSDDSEDGSSGDAESDDTSFSGNGSGDESESMSMTMSLSMGGDTTKTKSRAMSIDELAATYDGNNNNKSRRRASAATGSGGGAGMPLVESRHIGATASAGQAPFKLEVGLVDVILSKGAAAGVADRVTVTFEFDGESHQVSHSFRKQRPVPPTVQFNTSLADLAAVGKAHDAATLRGFVWSRSTTVGSFRIEVRPLARAWALKQGGVIGSTLRLQRRLTVFRNEEGTQPVGNIELGLHFQPDDGAIETADAAGDYGGGDGGGYGSQALVNGGGGGYGGDSGMGAGGDGGGDEVDLELNLASRRIYSLAETGFNWEPLLQIASLDLSKNQFAVLSAQTMASPPLHALRHLDLSRNNIERIDPEAFRHVPLVEKLDLSHNRVSRCHGFGQLRRLRELNLAHNRIRLVGGLHTAQELQRLDLSHNKIQSAIALRPVSLNTKLHTLIVLGNPMAVENRLYRASIIGLLPSLAVLDGRPMPRNTVKYTAMQKAAKKVAADQDAADRERQRRRRIGNLGSSQQRGGPRALTNQQPATHTPVFSTALHKAVPKVEVRVVGAKHLLCDDGSIGDAYVHLRYADKEARTETLTLAKDPTWPDEAPMPLGLQRHCAQLQVAAWNEDRRTGDTLYGRHTVDLVPVLEELHRLQEEQRAQQRQRQQQQPAPVEIRRVFRLEGNSVLKVSPTLQLAFSIPLERQLQVARLETKGETDEVKAMKKKLRDFKNQQAIIERLAKPSRTYHTNNGRGGARGGRGGGGGGSAATADFEHVKPGAKLQVPPTFRTKLYGPRKTLGQAKEQIRAQGRNAARGRAARTQSTIKELNSELAKVSLGQKKSELRQAVELERVSNQLMATRKKLAEYATFKPKAQSRRTELERTLATPLNMVREHPSHGGRGGGRGGRGGLVVNSAQKKFVIARRMREWIEHMQEEQSTAATGLKVLVRMADSGGAAMNEQKLVGFREQVADCGLLKPVTVTDEVDQATANDAQASGAVDSLVRRISMLQAAIRHLLGLLETAVEQSGGAPDDQDLVPAREYVAFLRDSVLGRHLGAQARRQRPMSRDSGGGGGGGDGGSSGPPGGHRRHSSISPRSQQLGPTSSGASSPRSGYSRSGRRGDGRGRQRKPKQKQRGGGGGGRGHGEDESLFDLFSKRMGEEIPDSSVGGQSQSQGRSESQSQSYNDDDDDDDEDEDAQSGSRSGSGSGAASYGEGTLATETEATEYEDEEEEEEDDDDDEGETRTSATSPTSQTGGSSEPEESLMEEEEYEEETEAVTEEEDEDEEDGAGASASGGSLMEEETIYESDSGVADDPDASMY